MIETLGIVAILGVLALLAFLIWRMDPRSFEVDAEASWKRIKLGIKALAHPKQKSPISSRGPALDASEPDDPAGPAKKAA